MTFFLRFKRTKRYEVSSKSSYVVGIHMLDNSFLECTLCSDSTGQECLESIAQRIDLSEEHMQYFGLRYVTKKLEFHWIDLAKPLKKQIERNAQLPQTPRLYFGVMFYIPGAHNISDPVARSQYFLQLNSDIVDGRIPIHIDQVVRLAALCLQVKFGDYNTENVVEEYFEDSLFPKLLCKDESIRREMMNKTLQIYISLVGLPSLSAELQYMNIVEQMDDYGVEYYLAKDDKMKDLYLGTSHIGIVARYLDGQAPTMYRWENVEKLSHSKKMLDIHGPKHTAHYQMEDSETSKYLCRVGTQLKKFYKNLENILRDLQQNALQQAMFDDQLNQSQTSLTHSHNSTQSQGYDQGKQHDELSQSTTAEEYHRQSQQSLDLNDDLDINHGNFFHENSFNSGRMGNSNHLNSVNSHQATNSSQPTNYVPRTDISARQSVLPAYRPAPSYEDVMRYKLSQQSPVHSIQGSGQNLMQQRLYAHESLSYTHSHVGSSIPTYPVDSDYANSTTLENYNSSTLYANVFNEEKNNFLAHYRVNNNLHSNLIIQPTNSTPELNSHGIPQEHVLENRLIESANHPCKAPPPYPRVSSSTPDLAAQTTQISHVSDSPDLVSRKTLGLSANVLHTNSENMEAHRHQTFPKELELQQHISQGEMPVDVSVTPVFVAKPEPPEHDQDHDDASSDQSGATFHVKDTDIESEDESGERTLKRESVKRESNIQIKYVAPNKAPPPSTSKEIVTRRESFRRMMIARTGQRGATTIADKDTAPENLKKDVKAVNKEKILSSSQNPVERKHSLQSELPRTGQSGANVERKLSLLTNLERNSSYRGAMGAGILTQEAKVMGLDVVPPADNLMKQEAVKKIQELSAQEETYDAEAGSDSDSDTGQNGTIKRKVGPLKMAALNGLTLSRPMVLALINDESRAPTDERRKLLESKLSENLVFKEFEEVPKKVMTMECTVARLPENISKNQFRDVLPYDATRVKISPRKDNPSGYINASHIKLSVGDRNWWYIATQAPMENTAEDFWQMVWEQEVDVIAMLTALVEMGKRKCFEYWPQEIGPGHKLHFGQFEVALLFSNDSLCYVTNRISVVNTGVKKERQIWHLQYTDWPDHGCPDDMYGFLGFLDEVDSVQRLAESEEGSGKKSPVLVHCSAGVGRSGVVILTQVMKWCLEHNHAIDLQKELAAIRQQRMFMVQTLGQYNFIHRTLIQYLKNTRLI